MADLGNIGVEKRVRQYSKSTAFAWSKAYSVVATITGGTAGEVVHLFQSGGLLARGGVNGSGNATFYELDDGEYHVRECLLDAHAWKVDVSGASVTVTPLTPGGGGGGSGTTRAYGFFGT